MKKHLALQGVRCTPVFSYVKNPSDSEARTAVDEAIKAKDSDLKDKALGTTPRNYTDLIGSLCDLMSGSGDKGTPIVLVQGYFDNYAS